MSFTSHTAFWNFDRSVRQAFRYARTSEQAEFLDAVTKTSGSRVQNLKAGAVFYRAQLGHGWAEAEIAPGVCEHFPSAHGSERMVPDAQFVGDGRVNAKGIVCLYLSTKEETAALEVRPLIGSYISIAQFQIVRDLRIVDCSVKLIEDMFAFLTSDLTPEEIGRKVWTDINDAFSAPVERADGGLTYVPTQIIAETLRLQGYDGIAYKSGYGEDGFNMALFDVGAAELRSCGLHRVGEMRVKLDMADNPYFVTGSKVVQAVVTDIRPVAEPEV